MKIEAGLSVMPTNDFAVAAYPLFEQGLVEAITWGYDMPWRMKVMPDWLEDLLNSFSSAGRLSGHGVSFSVLSGTWTRRHAEYVDLLTEEVNHRNYFRISEHFGFARAGRFAYNTVLPAPYSVASIECGLRNLSKLQAVAKVPIGLENLAFAFSLEDVKTQGQFLERLLAPIEGYLVLDLHNVYCQMCNFNLSLEDVIQLYPLNRVQEIHISGGSWSYGESRPKSPIRRDTHDESVPDILFELLRYVITKCPHLDYVFLERIGGSLVTEEDQRTFHSDFRKLLDVLQDGERQQPDYQNTGGPLNLLHGEHSRPLNDDVSMLARFQSLLLNGLFDDLKLEQLQVAIHDAPELQRYLPYVRSFQPHMVDTARLLVKKWGELEVEDTTEHLAK